MEAIDLRFNRVNRGQLSLNSTYSWSHLWVDVINEANDHPKINVRHWIINGHR